MPLWTRPPSETWPSRSATSARIPTGTTGSGTPAGASIPGVRHVIGSRHLLNALHSHMAELREELDSQDAWGVILAGSTVTPAMLECLRTPGRLLHRDVYEMILVAAGSTTPSGTRSASCTRPSSPTSPTRMAPRTGTA